jgi:WD40 repeat protein
MIKRVAIPPARKGQGARADPSPEPAKGAPKVDVADSDSSFEVLPRPIAPRSFPLRPPSSGKWNPSRLPIVDRSLYTVEADVAQGGIGRILRARDGRLGRPVAIKELRADHAGPDAERFVREVMITAKLQHPSIVTIYEAGRWPTGEPFYAMELVDGRSLAEVIAEARKLDARLALLPHVIAAADAMAYAHARGIIHRDLKPANILVGSFGETVVIDWGLGKDLSDEGARPEPALHGVVGFSPDSLTMAGAVLGTPEYMPREQAAGEPVDERADVYALGAILYHVVAGIPPYVGKAPLDVIRKVLLAPPRPLEERQPHIPRDLLTIVKKAMARDPAARYPTARELAEDLRRFSTGQIVSAHAYSRVERLRRFVRRGKAAIAVGLAALCVLAVVGTVLVQRILAARDQAQARQREAEAAHEEAVHRADTLMLVQARAAASRDPARAVAWLRALSPGFDRWSAARTIAEDARAHGVATVLRGHTAAINDIAFSPDGRWVATTSDDRTVRAWDVATGKGKAFTGHSDEAWGLLFLPDSKTLASAGKDRTIRLDLLEGGAGTVLAGHEGAVSSLAASPDGTHLVSGSYDRTVRVWDTATGKSTVLRGPGDEIRAVALSSDRRWVAAGRMDGTVQLWDLDRGNLRSLGKLEAAVLQLVFAPGDHTLAAALWNGASYTWDPAVGFRRKLGAPIRGYDPPSYHALAFSRDGRLVVYGSDDGVVVQDTTTGEARTLRSEGRVTSLALSASRRFVAAGAVDHVVRLWDLTAPSIDPSPAPPLGAKPASVLLPARTFPGFDSTAVIVAFSPDDKLLAAAGSADHAVKLYPLADESPAFVAHPGGASTARFSDDGRLLVTGGADGAARVWPIAGVKGPSGQPVVLAGARGVVEALPAQGGARIVTAGEDGAVRVYDASGRMLRSLEARPGKGVLLCLSPDGRRVAYAGASDTVRIADVETGEVRTFVGHEGFVRAVAFSPKGNVIASAGQDATVRLWDLASGEGRVLHGHTGRVTALAFSPDGAVLASGGADHTVRLWRVASGEGAAFPVGGGGVLKVIFAKDGKTLLLTSQLESNVQLLDPVTGTVLGELVGHEGEIEALALSPDGTRVAAATAEGAVRLWDVKTREGRLLAGHRGPARDVAFSPDGTFLVSAGDDGMVRVWPDDLPQDPAALRAWIARAGSEGVEALIGADRP